MQCLTSLMMIGLLIGGTPESKTVHADGPIAVQLTKWGPKQLLANKLLVAGSECGMNFLKPDDTKSHGDPAMDYSRVPATYYHPRGPAGAVMEKFNWLPGKFNTFASDVRMPAALVGLGAMPLPFCSFPDSQLTSLWSEPPYATVNLYAGAMAAYAHPLQVAHFYENDSKLIELFLPTQGEPLFTYLSDAKKRGAAVEVYKGKERKALASGPKNFYHAIVVEAFPRTRPEDLAVDLITKEGMQALFESLTEEGILCYHISNRFIDAAPVIAAAARSFEWEHKDPATGKPGKKYSYAAWVGLDQAPLRDKIPDGVGHYHSKWVIVARKQEYLIHKDKLNGKVFKILECPVDYIPRLKEEYKANGWEWRFAPFWQPVLGHDPVPWTDKSKHSIKGLLWTDPAVHRLEGFLKMGVKITSKFFPWKAVTGAPPPENISLHELGRIVADFRQQFDPTIEDLQAGYPRE